MGYQEAPKGNPAKKLWAVIIQEPGKPPGIAAYYSDAQGQWVQAVTAAPRVAENVLKPFAERATKQTGIPHVFTEYTRKEET